MAKATPQHQRPSIGKARTHKRKATAKHTPQDVRDRQRGSTYARGYDKRWERFRVAFLLSNPLCEYCAAQGKTVPATVVDHDLPHEGDKELFWSNTFTGCCVTCHSSLKQRMERRYSGDELLAEIARRKAVR